VDLINNEIFVRAMNTKTFTNRIVPIMTPRLRVELQHRLSAISEEPDSRPLCPIGRCGIDVISVHLAAE